MSSLYRSMQYYFFIILSHICMEGIINSKKSSTYQIDIFLKFISTQVFKNGLLILQWNFLQLRFGINLKNIHLISGAFLELILPSIQMCAIIMKKVILYST